MGKTIRNYDGDGLKAIKKQKPKNNRHINVDDYLDDDDLYYRDHSNDAEDLQDNND